MKLKALVLSLLLALTAAATIFIRIRTNQPPGLNMLQAGKLLSEARLEKAPGYSGNFYREAEMFYDSALAEWKIQNDRFILFRNYGQVTAFAKSSSECSEIAINSARKNISDTEDILAIRIGILGGRINKFEENFGRFPLSQEHRNELLLCRLIYSEGVLAYKNNNYSACKSKLDSAEGVIARVSDHYAGMLTAYLEEFPAWQGMVKQTIIHSAKSGSCVIIVDKLDRQLFLYKNGNLSMNFPIELGSNWVGDKQQQGDKATPEGMYKIVDKKQNGHTKYYKACLLNYPNEEDERRFSHNQNDGLIKQGASIGNLIEIHGNGGKGIDWTDGCIALRNPDMDVIFRLCPAGTRVTIVGSLRSWKKLSFDYDEYSGQDEY